MLKSPYFLFNIADHIFGQSFDRGFGEGTNDQYSIQYYPAEGKT